MTGAQASLLAMSVASTRKSLVKFDRLRLTKAIFAPCAHGKQGCSRSSLYVLVFCDSNYSVTHYPANKKNSCNFCGNILNFFLNFADRQVKAVYLQVNATHSQVNVEHLQVNVEHLQVNAKHLQVNGKNLQLDGEDSQVNDAHSQVND